MSTLERVPKVCGADVELGNFILGGDAARSGAEASRALLREIDGSPGERCETTWYGPGAPFVAANGYSTYTVANPQDWGRKYLATNGGCFYIDLNHLELCTPEVTSAFDHVAAWHAMLRIARRAMTAANAKLPPGKTIQVLVNNSDGQSNAYGSHLSFLVTRRAWENLFARRVHYLLYLAAYQISSLVFTGAGKVGAENGAPDVDFQLSQRADFFETLVGEQTTYRRPIVNARDEGLCGPRDWSRPGRARPGELARLHCIFFDSTLCQVATLLKVGVMQIVLAMIEAERIDPRLILDEPLEALNAWSHDPALRQQARTASGRVLTAVELQLCFLDEARRFVEEGGCEGIVPRAPEILALWADTLEKLHARNYEALAGRLDWVLKRAILERAMERRPGLTWGSPQMKVLDHLYAALGTSDGLHWAYAAQGAVEPVVAEERIVHFETEPPEDTRAWTRAMLLRAAGPDGVDDVDWDWVRFRARWSQGGYGGASVDLPNPAGFTKADVGHLFEGERMLDDVIERLRAASTPRRRTELVVVTPVTFH